MDRQTTGQLERKINMNVVTQVRNKQPLIHHVTNQVVMNFTANGLLAFGGSPIMAKEKLEARSMASIANGVLLNIGTIVESEVDAMIIAGQTANERGIPVVLDPVGVAATPFRTEVVQTLLDHISFTAIKGNAGEMAHLVDVAWKTKGVESLDDHLGDLNEIAIKVAKKHHTIAVVTGKTDVIANNHTLKTNDTGHHYLTKITGAGCLLGSILTACVTTDTPTFDAAYSAVHFYGQAAEIAAAQPGVHGTGTFIPHFLDELAK